MARRPEMDEDLVADIARKFGPVIDLEKQPHVLLEILREHGFTSPGDIRGMGSEGGGGMGGSGGMGSMSTMAGGMNSTPRGEQEVAELNELMRAVLDLRKEVAELSKSIRAQGGPQA